MARVGWAVGEPGAMQALQEASGAERADPEGVTAFGQCPKAPLVPGRHQVPHMSLGKHRRARVSGRDRSAFRQSTFLGTPVPWSA